MQHLLIPLCFLLSAITLRAQLEPIPRGPYVSARAGIGAAFEGGYILGSTLGGGYQWNRWVGVGAGLAGYLTVDYYGASFTGAALQYRLRPNRHWAVTLDAGLIVSHYQGNNVSVFEYIPDAYPYGQLFVTGQPFGALSLGLGLVTLPMVRYRICTDIQALPEDCPATRSIKYHWTASGVLFTLGITLD